MDTSSVSLRLPPSPAGEGLKYSGTIYGTADFTSLYLQTIKMRSFTPAGASPPPVGASRPSRTIFTSPEKGIGKMVWNVRTESEGVLPYAERRRFGRSGKEIKKGSAQMLELAFVSTLPLTAKDYPNVQEIFIFSFPRSGQFLHPRYIRPLPERS